MENNEQLLRRIEALEKWQKERQAQQIVFPLDVRSMEILNKDFLRIIQEVAFFEGDAVDGYELITHYITKQDNKFVDLVRSKLIPYTVDINTNYLTIQSNVNLEDDFILYFTTTGIQPAVLNLAIPYYVINSTGQRFQISETSGGAAVDFADIGTESQFIRTYFNQTV